MTMSFYRYSGDLAIPRDHDYSHPGYYYMRIGYRRLADRPEHSASDISLPLVPHTKSTTKRAKAYQRVRWAGKAVKDFLHLKSPSKDEKVKHGLSSTPAPLIPLSDSIELVPHRR